MPTRYAAYARVSTSEQAERGKSIEDQLAKLQREASARGGVLVGTFADPGFSGSMLKRPQLTALLAFCQEGGADAVLVVDTDRLARKTEHHFVIKAQLKKFGVRVESLNQPMIDDTPEGVFLDTILAATNALYPQITGRKTSLSMAEKAAAGWWPGPARLGYRNADNPSPTSANDRRIIVPHETMGPLVTRAFALYATGKHSLSSLCAVMEGLGLRGSTGGRISTTSMRKVLGDPFYVGRAPYKGETRRWKHVPLTDEETLDRCRLVLAQHNRYADRMRKHEFVLSGLVHCGICGAPYTASVNKAKGKAYYHCPLNRGVHSNLGQNTAVDVLDAQAAELLRHVAFSPASVERIMAQAKALLDATHGDVDVKRRELLAQQAKLENRRNQVETKYLDDEITGDTYRRQAEGIGETLVGISLELSRLNLSRESNIGLFEQLMRLSTDFEAAYAAADSRLRRTYLCLCFEKLVVQDRKIVEAFPTEAFDMALAMERAAISSGGAFTKSARTKTTPNLQAARSADTVGTPAHQVDGTVIKIRGWLPSPSEFITFLQDILYWNQVSQRLSVTQCLQ